MRRIAARDLPEDPLAASLAFDLHHRPAALAVLALDEDLLIEFDPASHTHEEWRRAAVAMLARAHAPLRVNAVAGAQGDRFEEVVRYLGQAPGVTGQYLQTAESGAFDPDQ